MGGNSRGSTGGQRSNMSVWHYLGALSGLPPIYSYEFSRQGREMRDDGETLMARCVCCPNSQRGSAKFCGSRSKPPPWPGLGKDWGKWRRKLERGRQGRQRQTGRYASIRGITNRVTTPSCLPRVDNHDVGRQKPESISRWTTDRQAQTGPTGEQD